MAGQCWALILLKFRLMRSMWSGVHTFSLLISLLTMSALFLFALAASVGLFFLGWQGMPRKDPLLVLGILDSLILFYLFLWAWGLLMELQRSDVIDLRKLLFLPISPRMVFVLNFIASLFGPALIFFVPASLGLLGGLSMRHGPQVMLWGVPLAASFFIMLGAWSYYVRGWLAVMMENKRRRRLILTLLPLVFVVLGQLPGLVTASLNNAKNDPAQKDFIQELALDKALLLGNQILPPAWLPYGVWAVTRGNYQAAAASIAGCIVVAGIGLLLGYAATIRFYLGGGSGKITKQNTARPTGRPLTARRFPLLDADTAALASASFLSYLRHPNIRMLIIMPLCMGFLVVFMYRSGAYGGGAQQLSAAGGRAGEWATMAVLVWPFFNFSYVLFNIFGIDRESFRGLVLLPTARYKFLLAKNLALFPFVGGVSLAFVAGGGFLLGLEPRQIALSALQVVQMFLLYAAIGNIVSILLPHHIGWNGARSGNSRVLMMCIGICSALMLGVIMLPTTLCLFIDDIAQAAFDYNGFPLGLPVSLLFLALTGTLYYFLLRFSGDLLRDREVRILERLLRDRE
jgi:ABC-2 type transport system permease protein